MTIHFMKFLDEYAGWFIASLLAAFYGKKSGRTRKNLQNILVIKFWGIGSVTLSIPLLVCLKKKYPGCAIHFLTLENNAALCALIQEIDCIHTVSVASFFSFFKTLTKTIIGLRREHIDCVFDLEFFTNVSAIISVLSGAAERVGFVNFSRPIDARKKLYAQQVEFRYDKHTAENFLRLNGEDDAILFSPFRLAEGRGTDSTFPKRRNQFSVLFNINASPLAYERRWEKEEFRQLAEFLIEEFDAYLYLTGTRDEHTYVQEFFESLHITDAVTNLCGVLDIRELIRFMSNCQLVVTNDSGPLHLASALNIPTISFFGPETPMRYGSLAERHLTFYKNLWCSPCMTVSNLKTVNCINNRQCMKQIRFSEIKEEINSFVRSLPKIQNEITEHSAAGET